MQRLYVGPKQYELARKLADKIKEDRIVCDMNEHDFTRSSSDFLGFLGEIVVADFVGLDRPVLLNGKTDGGFDLLLNGERVDLKVTGFGGVNPCLVLFKEKSYSNVDCFVLLVLRDGFFSVVGKVSKKVFFENCVERDLGFGSRLVLESSFFESFKFVKG